MYSDELTVTKLSKLRIDIKPQAEKLGIKISFMPFFIKAVSNALKRYPILNATLGVSCENIIYNGYHNIGIAMDTKNGLAVPVIKNVENLGVMEIAKKLNELIANGKSGVFGPEDLIGGTFSISNIGIVCCFINLFIPIISFHSCRSVGCTQAQLLLLRKLQ